MLAEFLSNRLSQITAEQISFEHPSCLENNNSGINLYFYDIQINSGLSQLDQRTTVDHPDSCQIRSHPNLPGFDVSFLLTVKDNTRMGEQHLLSEVFLLLSQYRYLPRSSLNPALEAPIKLPMQLKCVSDPAQFWRALQTPMHPALYITVTVPLSIHLVHSETCSVM